MSCTAGRSSRATGKMGKCEEGFFGRFYGLHLKRVNWVAVPMTVELFMHMQWRVEKEFFSPAWRSQCWRKLNQIPSEAPICCTTSQPENPPSLAGMWINRQIPFIIYLNCCIEASLSFHGRTKRRCLNCQNNYQPQRQKF